MTIRTLLLTILLLSVLSKTEAIVDDTVDPYWAAEGKLTDERQNRNQEALIKEKKRLQLAEERAEKIRALPPESIPLWTKSRQTDEDLDKLLKSSSSSPTKATRILQHEKKHKFLTGAIPVTALLILIFLCGIWKIRRKP